MGRTGYAGRVLLILLWGVCLVGAVWGWIVFLRLALGPEDAAGEIVGMERPMALLVSSVAASAATIGFVVAFVGYLVLVELQAQTERIDRLRLGGTAGQGSDLRVGRRDSRS